MKKYVLIGTGGRGYHMYGKPIVERFNDVAELVGLYDPNSKRSQYVSENLGNIPTYTDFDKMMDELKPDTAIITTVDKNHKEYIIRSFEKGCDVICEKPLTINDVMCKEILEAEEKYGRKVIVTFNCRFMPFFVTIKELLREGVVGDILNVDFEWLLDTGHGADYFRRWHRMQENSGGLLVHKSTHHFDIINWLIEQDPVSISANGTLKVYGDNRKEKGERCLTCAHKENCEFVYRDGEIPWIKAMYFEAESEDGYYRDRCIFDPEINIYDNMSLSVKYSKDALLSYSLIAHSPYEGWKLAISGTNGRLEAEEYYTGVQANSNVNQLRLYDRKGHQITYDVPKGAGSHGGGDEKLLRMLLRGDVEDTLDQYAGSRDGVLSAIIGIAANKSIAEERTVTVEELVGKL